MKKKKLSAFLFFLLAINIKKSGLRAATEVHTELMACALQATNHNMGTEHHQVALVPRGGCSGEDTLLLVQMAPPLGELVSTVEQ